MDDAERDNLLAALASNADTIERLARERDAACKERHHAEVARGREQERAEQAEAAAAGDGKA